MSKLLQSEIQRRHLDGSAPIEIAVEVVETRFSLCASLCSAGGEVAILAVGKLCCPQVAARPYLCVSSGVLRVACCISCLTRAGQDGAAWAIACCFLFIPWGAQFNLVPTFAVSMRQPSALRAGPCRMM